MKLSEKVVVENLESSRGRAVPNQFRIVYDDGTSFFQSYKTLILKKTQDGKLYFNKNYWDYSSTTSKYRNIFTGLTTKETKNKIKSGEIELIDFDEEY